MIMYRNYKQCSRLFKLEMRIIAEGLCAAAASASEVMSEEAATASAPEVDCICLYVRQLQNHMVNSENSVSSK